MNVRFRSSYRLLDTDIFQPATPRVFDVAGKHEVPISVRLVSPGNVPQVRLTSEPAFRCRCEASVTITAPRRPAKALEALAEQRLPEDHQDLTGFGERPYFMKDGRVAAAPYQVLPAHTQAFALEALQELEDATRRVVSVVRWRMGDTGPSQPLERERDEWSLDGDQWIPLLRPWDGAGRVGRLVTLTDAIRDESQRLLDDNLAEPFAHELWREAWGLRLAHPRSALLIGVSALEVGIKHHIAKVVPDAEWLILELQSPPVHRLLNEYVPAVHDLDEGSLLTAEEKSLLRKSIERRNRITHAGDQTVDEQMLDNALHLIRGLLRRLDALRGHTWAALELPPAMHDDDGNLVE